MEYTVVRSRRKSLAVCVNREGEVLVRAPLRAPNAQIARFVEQEAGWIAEKSALLRERAARRREFRMELGSMAPFLGREYPVLAGESASFTGSAFLVRPDREVKPQLVALYRTLALPYLTERTALFAKRMGVAPKGVRITGAKTRFGSCSGKNSLCFTWRLILADPELIDYVAVHELCHIRQHNHSPLFWAEVEAVLPDYRERERRLKAFGRALQEQDWEDRSV